MGKYEVLQEHFEDDLNFRKREEKPAEERN